MLACGQCFLEVGANPYVTTLGPRESAPWRLNTAQAFNSLGAVVTPIIGATFILSGVEHTPAQIAAMSPAELDAYRTMEAGMIRGPYLVIAGIFVVMAAIFWRAHLPEVAENERSASRQRHAGHRDLGLPSPPPRRRRAVSLRRRAGGRGELRDPVRAADDMPGTPEKTAAEYLTWHLFGFMIGRVLTAGTLKDPCGRR